MIETKNFTVDVINRWKTEELEKIDWYNLTTLNSFKTEEAARIFCKTISPIHVRLFITEHRGIVDEVTDSKDASHTVREIKSKKLTQWVFDKTEEGD